MLVPNRPAHTNDEPLHVQQPPRPMSAARIRTASWTLSVMSCVPLVMLHEAVELSHRLHQRTGHDLR